MSEINEFPTKDMLSSVYVNFLFGSGVNGKEIGQFNSFTKTISLLKSKLNKDISDLEKAIDELKNENDIEEVRKKFDDEFKEKLSKVNYESDSIKHIGELFLEVYKMVLKSEKRVDYLNQINIYTLNYDDIVENVLKSNGLLVNTVAPSNIDSNKKYYNILGYDMQFKKFVPTFLVSKIHGDSEQKVLPGYNKYKDVLGSKVFEIMFKMKENLFKMNSLLFVIGYKGNDQDVNEVIYDAIKFGLSVYWYCYSDKDYNDVPDKLKDLVVRIKVNDSMDNGSMDSTLKCMEDLRKVWEE